MSDNKKIKTIMTSIEWLIMQLPVSIRVEFYEKNIYLQAKEMHKQEIKNAFTEGEFNVHNSKRDEEFEYETPEQYYQETFNKEL